MSTSSQQEDDKIPEVVAELEMLTFTTTIQETKRVLRRRIRPACEKRRVKLKPVKRTFSEMENEDDARRLYLNKSVKESPHTLETIYEEDEHIAIDANEQPQMSTKRFKRMINFQRKPNDSNKQKKRRLKIKKVFGSKLSKPRRMELKDVLKRLESIHHSNSSMDTEHNNE